MQTSFSYFQEMQTGLLEDFDYLDELLSNDNNIELEIKERQQDSNGNGLKEPTARIELPYGSGLPKSNGSVKNSLRSDAEINDASGVAVDKDTESVSPILFSERTWTASEYVRERDKAAKDIAQNIGVSVKKAKA